MSFFIPLLSPVSLYNIDRYLLIYLFATFVISDVISHKTHRNVQVTQQPISFVIFSTTCDWISDYINIVVKRYASSKAAVCLESSFLITLFKKYVLQMFENVI